MNIFIAAFFAFVASGCGTSRPKFAAPVCPPITGQSGTANFYKDKAGTILAYARCGTDSRNMPGISYQTCPTAADKTAIETLIETVCSGSAPTVTPTPSNGQVAPQEPAQHSSGGSSGSSSSNPPVVAPTRPAPVPPVNPPVNPIEPITTTLEPTTPEPPAPSTPEPKIETTPEVVPAPDEDEEEELHFSS